MSSYSSMLKNNLKKKVALKIALNGAWTVQGIASAPNQDKLELSIKLPVCQGVLIVYSWTPSINLNPYPQ